VIRSLAPDELPWFLARAFAFVGHGDPWGLAQRCSARLRDPRRDAERAWVVTPPSGEPTAGVVALPPDRGRDDPTLRLAQPWYAAGCEGDFLHLIDRLRQREVHEAVELDLSALPARVVVDLSTLLAPQGFEGVALRRLAFDLADTPPLGRPLVLEGFTPEADARWRAFVAAAEGVSIGERRWAWLKRATGPFTPDAWLLAYESLELPPVGYALAGRRGRGFASEFTLAAVGVDRAYRGSTEMLRRLVLSVLHEFSAQSPWGVVRADVPERDPKLIDILRSLGFAVGDVRWVLRFVPDANPGATLER
jgi:hypothetical protein